MKNNIKNKEIKTLIKLTNFKNNYNDVNPKQDIIKFYKIANMDILKDKTNHSDKRLYKINNDFTYEYTYERFDGYLNYANFAQDFYNLKGKYKSKVFFTNSGMSAISSLIYAIKHLNQIIEIHNHDIYFETFKLFNDLKILKDKNSKILYLDSISQNFSIEKNLNNFEIIIIDTTCFLASSLSSYIHEILAMNKIVILVRSHTKLDMLGTEYAHLGSILFLIPVNISKEKFDFSKRLMQKTFEMLGRFGALAKISDIPYFIFDKKFYKINNDRIKRIAANNLNFYNLLLKENINCKIILPKHQKFILIVPKENQKIAQDVLSEKLKKFIKNKLTNYNAFYACSFGFDYIAFDSYYDINLANFVIRISMSDDININNIQLAKMVKDFLNENF